MRRKYQVPMCPQCGTIDCIGQNIIAFRSIQEWDEKKPYKYGKMYTDDVLTKLDAKPYYCEQCGEEFDEPYFEEIIE